VSGPSTVLTESIGVASRIFIWDEVGGAFKYPEHIFERFGSVSELIEALEVPPGDCPDRPDVAEVWAPDWRQTIQRLHGPVPNLTAHDEPASKSITRSPDRANSSHRQNRFFVG
jgi:hypothetical protein